MIIRYKDTFRADLLLGIQHFLFLAALYLRKPNNELVYYNLLFSIAIAANPKTILELGVGPGVSSMAFARALQYYRRLGGNGVLHTCDIDPVMIKKLERFVRFGSLVLPHLMSTDELTVEWAKQSTPIDLLYIDAWHSHEQSLKDFENFAPYVVPNGLILMHDTFPLSEESEQIEFSGSVWKTAKYVKEHYRSEYEIMTLPFLCGISLIRKKGSKYF